MKLVISVFLVICCFFSVSGQVTRLEEYNQSLMAWTNLSADSYTYVVPFRSWSGYRDETTITVLNGMIVRREFQSFRLDNGAEVGLDHWVEEGTQLGSHDQGAPRRTMEDNYTYCRNQVLIQDPVENSIYFEVDERGILKQCAYFPNNCADDCLMGITIDSLIIN